MHARKLDTALVSSCRGVTHHFDIFFKKKIFFGKNIKMMSNPPITPEEGCISLLSVQMELPPKDLRRQTTFIETILRLNNIYGSPFLRN